MNPTVLQRELLRMSKRDLQALCKIFDVRSTKQSGGYFSKDHTILRRMMTDDDLCELGPRVKLYKEEKTMRDRGHVGYGYALERMDHSEQRSKAREILASLRKSYDMIIGHRYSRDFRRELSIQRDVFHRLEGYHKDGRKWGKWGQEEAELMFDKAINAIPCYPLLYITRNVYVPTWLQEVIMQRRAKPAFTTIWEAGKRVVSEWPRWGRTEKAWDFEGPFTRTIPFKVR
jgi:hypothetical protein